jgi:hypothetical protein
LLQDKTELINIDKPWLITLPQDKSELIDNDELVLCFQIYHYRAFQFPFFGVFEL